jgi:hypothetical protein
MDYDTKLPDGVRGYLNKDAKQKLEEKKCFVDRLILPPNSYRNTQSGPLL